MWKFFCYLMTLEQVWIKLVFLKKKFPACLMCHDEIITSIIQNTLRLLSQLPKHVSICCSWWPVRRKEKKPGIAIKFHALTLAALPFLKYSYCKKEIFQHWLLGCSKLLVSSNTKWKYHEFYYNVFQILNQIIECLPRPTSVCIYAEGY